jgi:hypothetical protein
MTDLVKIKFILPQEPDGYPLDQFESVWAVPEGSSYRIDNIPFFVRGVACGDLVSVSKQGDEICYRGLDSAGGHSTVRVLVTDEADAPVRQVRDELRQLGCPSELSHVPGLIAVDVPPHVNYDNLRKFLDTGESEGRWEYEEGCVARKVSPPA